MAGKEGLGMSLQVHEIGSEKNRVVTIDGFLQSPDAVVNMASAMVPFPKETGSYYPGHRRKITPLNKDAYAYVAIVCEGLAPLMSQIFGTSRFQITDACFSMVTAQPSTLLPLQCAPHCDTTDANSFAILH